MTAARYNLWLSRREAAAKLAVSPDTIERRGVEWHETAVPHRIRYKFLVLDEASQPVRRYYEPDVEAMVLNRRELPPAARLHWRRSSSRPRQIGVSRCWTFGPAQFRLTDHSAASLIHLANLPVLLPFKLAPGDRDL